MNNRIERLIQLLIILALTSTIATASGATMIDIQFVNHIQAGLPEQDVFIQRNDAAPNQVVRVEANDTRDPAILAKIVFATATTTPHDPFKLGSNPLGPYAKGASLGFTLQQWFAATGSGTYTVDGDNAEMKLSFQKLVPNGKYTVWCSRLTFPPDVKIVDSPCGAPDGSQNVLDADAQGNAAFDLKMKPLPDSSRETVSLIALAYHSDGKTHGASPGDFGLNSHVQIFFMIPPPPKPGEGWTLHIDAKRHISSNPDMIVHHYCKTVAGGLIECQLYDSDKPDARLIGVEAIVSAETYNTFNADEKALWHYHKTEIPKVEATLPDLSPEEAARVVKSLEETYGKVYILWDPGRSNNPVGKPEINILDSTTPKAPGFGMILAITGLLAIAYLMHKKRK
ncbi:MAG TPA: DUF1264 domain-containing protein [Candidatus Methanoperedens sp.]|nr:DUF1264 domain-containing protein [Candidatus Methanoperedens sp.]